MRPWGALFVTLENPRFRGFVGEPRNPTALPSLNAIDWASRSESEDEPPLAAYQGKVASIMSASPGALGGMRGLVFLRMLLGNIGITVLPNQKTIRKAYESFNEDGALRNERDHQAVLDIGRELAETIQKLRG